MTDTDDKAEPAPATAETKTDAEPAPVESAPAKPKRELSNASVRTLSTVVLLCMFSMTMWGGHIPCALVMFSFQALIVQELFELAQSVDQEHYRKMPLFRTQQWYFFMVSAFYLYGRFLRKNFPITNASQAGKFLLWMQNRHLIISYWMYTIGIVLFVVTLQQGMYQYQFRQFAWTHLIVFFTVVPTSFFVPLMFEGLVWFILPSGLIIVNDIMAYVAGKMFGRTPLIKLSPKKTVEGFVGGALFTVVAAVLLTNFLSQYEWMYCPRRMLEFNRLHCDKPDAFVPVEYHLTDLWEVLPDFVNEDFRPALWHFVPKNVRDLTASLGWTCMPATMHSIALAAFASIIGPFGGFFASGFKRALGVKDFGSSIPGHGGVTDRFDCQMLMAVFAYLYFHFYIAKDSSEMELLDHLLELGKFAKLRVFVKIGEMLVGEGLIQGEALANLLNDAGHHAHNYGEVTHR